MGSFWRTIGSVSWVLVLAAVAVVPQPMEAQNAETEWITDHVLYVEQEDPFAEGGAYGVRAFEEPRGSGFQDGKLTVRCMDGTLDVIVSGEYYGDDARPVVWRFDDGEVHTGRWGISTDGDAVFAPDVIEREIVDSAKRARTFHIRIEDYNGTRITYSIPLNGITAAVGRGMPCL